MKKLLLASAATALMAGAASAQDVKLGVLLGFLSSSNTGRNLCLVVLVICIIRLSLGGGIL